MHPGGDEKPKEIPLDFFNGAAPLCSSLPAACPSASPARGSPVHPDTAFDDDFDDEDME